MSLTEKILDVIGGGLVSNIIDVAKSYFPQDMSDAQKMEAEMKMLQIKAGVDLQIQDMLNESERAFNDRIIQMDGTAEQLKGIWFIGPAIILLRAIQRPIWGFGTLYMDWMVFSDSWKIPVDSREDMCFLVINLIVLIFLFGEKAFKNIAPLIERLLAVRK